jgi:thiol-disulfide isomerase/thioredoxin
MDDPQAPFRLEGICMRRTLLIALGLLTIAGCGQEPTQPKTDQVAAAKPAEPPAKPVVSVSAKPNDTAADIQVVKYNQLIDAVHAHKGKIVVVDVWATFCIPCMKEFPHLVELHQEHAKDGVVCMSVSVDDPEKKAAALKFLQSKGATFQNFLLDEEAEVWQKKWESNGVPIVFVFGRDGTKAARFVDEVDYKDVKAKVEELLKKN